MGSGGKNRSGGPKLWRYRLWVGLWMTSSEIGGLEKRPSAQPLRADVGDRGLQIPAEHYGIEQSSGLCGRRSGEPKQHGRPEALKDVPVQQWKCGGGGERERRSAKQGKGQGLRKAGPPPSRRLRVAFPSPPSVVPAGKRSRGGPGAQVRTPFPRTTFFFFQRDVEGSAPPPARLTSLRSGNDGS